MTKKNVSFLTRIFLMFSMLIVLAHVSAFAKSSTPRFMVMINEKNLGAYSVSEAENVITSYLLSKGLDVVDMELVKTNIDRDKALHAMMSGPQAAAALGLQFGAEVIVVGKAIVKGSAEHVKETSFRSYQARVSLKFIKTDTAEVLAYGNRSAARIHVDDVVGGSQAIHAATAALIADLMPRVLGRWKKQGKKGAHKIQLVISNVRQIWQIAAVKKLLRKQIRGIRSVIQRSFVSGVVIFDLIYSRDAQNLAEALTLAKSGYFSLKVVGITPGKLDVQLLEKGS
jgi:hypothetical protein